MSDTEVPCGIENVYLCQFSRKLMIQDMKNELYSTIELKHLNLRSVYNYLYDVGTASRLDISNYTGLSLPTVSANIYELQENGLVLNIGEQKSTGGRRAQNYSCNNLARVAIGVEILKECIQIVAIDIYGAILVEETIDTPFINQEAYYQNLGKCINTFSNQLPYEKQKLLGVCIALQGLISDDGETITFSEILKCTGVTRDRFQQYIELPCALVHDTEAAALAEIWHAEDISNAIYIALNRNFGGTLILNGQVHMSKMLSNSTIEHMCLDTSGSLCYCGKKGCVETFCSANRLKEVSGLEIPEFFNRLHMGDETCTQIWHEFLNYLAIAIDNIRMIVDCSFIIGGYLVQFMNDEDLELLKEYVIQRCFNKKLSLLMRPSRFGEKSPKLGAGIALVDSFLQSI